MSSDDFESPSTPVNDSVPTHVENAEVWMFGGPCPDTDLDAGHAWGAAYEVEEDGEVVRRDLSFKRIRQTFPGQEIPLQQAKDLASLVGRASACIYYKESDALSGFFIDEKTFLTCSHFIKWSTPDRAEQVEGIKRQDNGCVVIAPNREPFQNNIDNLKAHLLHEDIDTDYALFRLDNEQPPRTSNHCLGKDSIQPLSPERAKALKNHRLFTIGYNSNIQGKEWNDFAEKSKKLLTSPQRSNLDAIHRGNLNQTPDLKILHPGRRSIALGKFQGGQKSAQPPYRYLHTISGWYGISGSPIAFFQSQEGQPAKLVVIGLFDGGFPDEFGNHMTHFSVDDIEHIHSFCD